MTANQYAEARAAVYAAQAVVIWRKAAKQLAETLREAADHPSIWDRVVVLARAEVTLAQADCEHAERVYDNMTEEACP